MKNTKRKLDDTIEITDSRKAQHGMQQVVRWLTQDLYCHDHQKARGLTRVESDKLFEEVCEAG